MTPNRQTVAPRCHLVNEVGRGWLVTSSNRLCSDGDEDEHIPGRQRTTEQPTSSPPGLLLDPAVVLSGRWLAVARQAIHTANLARRRNALPESRDYSVLLDAIAAAMSRPRHCDTEGHPSQALSEQRDELTVDEVVRMLGRSKRTVQRMAPRLGGRLVGGRWLLDRRAVEEHLAGRDG